MTESCGCCGADASARPAFGIHDIGVCEPCRDNLLNRPWAVLGDVNEILASLEVGEEGLKEADPDVGHESATDEAANLGGDE